MWILVHFCSQYVVMYVYKVKLQFFVNKDGLKDASKETASESRRVTAQSLGHSDMSWQLVLY